MEFDYGHEEKRNYFVCPTKGWKVSESLVSNATPDTIQVISEADTPWESLTYISYSVNKGRKGEGRNRRCPGKPKNYCLTGWNLMTLSASVYSSTP